ncbi:MAG: FAD-binding protein [Gammaproteobacteria bacterium]|nr:FAD-binding protein [Gammaproteobacteria bacterium]
MNKQNDSTNWTNWEESIALTPAVVASPTSVDEVLEILADAKNFPSPVRAAGSRHSTTHCGVADQGTLLIMRNMDRITEIDHDNCTVTVEAGALYIDVAKELEKTGLQFYVNVEIGNLTMGSAACTGTKDASMPGEFGQVCSYCCAINLALPSGEIICVDDSDQELMQAMRSSYGLLGVVLGVTFRVKPIRAMKVYHKTYTLDEFEKALPALRERGESIMYYLFPFLDSLTVEFRQYIDSKPAKIRWVWRVRNAFWKTYAPAFSWFTTRFIRSSHLRYKIVDGFYRIIQSVMNNVLRSDCTYASDQQIRYPQKKGISKYTFSIWAFPEERIMPIMRAYYEFCREYYREHGFRCDMLNVGYRIAKDANPLFSYSYAGTVMTLDPVTTGAPGWDDFLRAYNEFCSQHDGIPLFNQSKWLTRSQVQKAFGGRISKFWRYKQRFDPNNRLMNDYFNNLLESDFKLEGKDKSDEVSLFEASQSVAV